MLPTRPSLRGSQSGFTLLELLTTLVLLAVMVSLAAPSMKGVTTRARTRAAIDQLTADVSLARMYAVRDGRRTVVSIASATKYVVARSPATSSNDTIKVVNLARDAVGVQLLPATGQLTFDSRGLLQTGSLTKVKATKDSKSDSVTISSVGRTYRDY
ncbi:MAG: GspH/FimT family protein [Longimicrobiaceae bacterium]|jgi:prepilin-type N-terminal cleavage/methylation domain-containing protein